LLRQSERTQGPDYPSLGKVATDQVERDFDRRVLVVQEAFEKIDRAPLLPPTYEGPAISLSPPSPGRALIWSEDEILGSFQEPRVYKVSLFFAETPSNPTTELVDIKALSEIAHQSNALLLIDNVFCTPVLQKPLQLGADIVVHSATKYIDGQGRCMGGAVVGNKKLVGEDIFGVLRNGGMSMSPFNAWVFTKGLETLSLRMQRHCQNAYELASWLDKHPAIEKVYYPGLSSHPQHQLAKEQQSDFGGMVSFVVKGGKDAAWKIVNSLKMLSITANLGDTKTTITHPATTTHGRLSQEQRDAADISDGLLRLSVGLEDIRDIKNDLSRGLDH